MKLPLIRVGLTLAVGSVVASAVRFYVAVGTAASDLNAPELPSNSKGFAQWFVQDFLFKGTVPTFLFWTGIAVAVVGIIRLALTPPRRPAQNQAHW